MVVFSLSSVDTIPRDRCTWSTGEMYLETIGAGKETPNSSSINFPPENTTEKKGEC